MDYLIAAGVLCAGLAALTVALTLRSLRRRVRWLEEDQERLYRLVYSLRVPVPGEGKLVAPDA